MNSIKIKKLNTLLGIDSFDLIQFLIKLWTGLKLPGLAMRWTKV